MPITVYTHELTCSLALAPFSAMTDKKKPDCADELFKNAPEHVKRLHKQSKKLCREVKRKLWWDQNKPK